MESQNKYYSWVEVSLTDCRYFMTVHCLDQISILCNIVCLVFWSVCLLMEDNQEEDLERKRHNWLCVQGGGKWPGCRSSVWVSRHLSGALGFLLINTISGPATQMDFKISNEAWPRWNPLSVYLWRSTFITAEGPRCSGQHDQCYLCCPYIISSDSSDACPSLRVSHRKQTHVQSATRLISVQRQTIFWQKSSMLHYYAKIIIHPQ